jgi:hypothetical protein
MKEQRPHLPVEFKLELERSMFGAQCLLIECTSIPRDRYISYSGQADWGYKILYKLMRAATTGRIVL